MNAWSQRLADKRLLLSGLAAALLACSSSGPPTEADVKSRFDGDPANVTVLSIGSSPGGNGCGTKEIGLEHRDEYPALVAYKQVLEKCGGILKMPGVNCGEKLFKGYFCMYQSDGKWKSHPGAG